MSKLSKSCALILACVALGAAAQPDRGPQTPLSVDELKAVYLECNRAAMQRPLGSAEAAQCSIAYEELKQRAFDGDFAKLLAWSRSMATPVSTTR